MLDFESELKWSPAFRAVYATEKFFVGDVLGGQ
jgi:hypothetical protein